MKRGRSQVYHQFMARVVTIPAETDVLCEGCGYVLNGLPTGANCPECGKPSVESSPTLRQPPLWEQAWEQSGRQKRLRAFFATTADLLLTPARFFRTLSIQPSTRASFRFAQIHWACAALLLGTATWAHLSWYIAMGGRQFSTTGRVAFLLAVCAATYAALDGTTRLAGWLTKVEAAYRGFRLPLAVVRRGLHYHAAHYLPVALIATATVLGYHLGLSNGWIAPTSGATYLYVLSAEVVIAAGYLFNTYWTAMRNLMYANR